jgi:hypothetical protein
LILPGIQMDIHHVFSLGLKERPACPLGTFCLCDLHSAHGAMFLSGITLPLRLHVAFVAVSFGLEGLSTRHMACGTGGLIRFGRLVHPRSEI